MEQLQQTEKIMFFKPVADLPSAFKFLMGEIPADLSPVVVLTSNEIGCETYLTVRFAGKKQAVLNKRHFFTNGQRLIYLKRKKRAKIVD